MYSRNTYWDIPFFLHQGQIFRKYIPAPKQHTCILLLLMASVLNASEQMVKWRKLYFKDIIIINKFQMFHKKTSSTDLQIHNHVHVHVYVL